jgi:quercetin dioxygenase-like cupin family protein
MTDRTATPGYELLIADAEALLTALPIEPGRVRSRLLFKTASVTVLGVAIDAGAIMHEHVAPSPVLIHVVDGRAAIELREQRIELPTGATIHIDGAVRHSIEGIAPSRFLLTLYGAPAQPPQSDGPGTVDGADPR